MANSKWLILVSLVVAVSLVFACTPKTEEQAKEVTEKIEDKAKEIAGETADKTREIAGEIADKSKEVVSATGEVITDGWITTKVTAKFADEKILKDSKINVDTSNRVVTLKGTVPSAAAKSRAATIARGTEGVVSVVDQLTVKAQ